MAIRQVRTLPRVPQYPHTDDMVLVLRYIRDQNTQLTEWYREYAERLNAAHNLPSFRVHRNGSDQTAIGTASFTKIQFNSIASNGTNAEGFDDWAYFDLATNFRYTPKIAGKYLFGVTGRFKVVVAATAQTVCIYKNGTSVAEGTGSSAGVVSSQPSVSTILGMNGTTDYVEFFAEHTSGVNEDLNGAADITHAWGCKVSD